MRRRSLFLALVLVAAVPMTATAAQFPDRIDLPDGFAPEGIAVGTEIHVLPAPSPGSASFVVTSAPARVDCSSRAEDPSPA